MYRWKTLHAVSLDIMYRLRLFKKTTVPVAIVKLSSIAQAASSSSRLRGDIFIDKCSSVSD